jgi:hypothetical protein
MNTEFLDRLANELRARQTAACRRAISRILSAVKERCAEGGYANQPEAERDFRERVAAEPLCHASRSKS